MVDIKNLTDNQLVERFIDGCQVSFEVLLSRHKDRVFSYIFMMVKDRELAEDLFQETFFKVIQSLKNNKYTDNGRFVSWTMRIAHNMVIDHFRRAKNISTISNDSKDYDLFSVLSIFDNPHEDTIINDQILADVRRLIQELPVDQREVLEMRYYQELSFKEIAEVTGVGINTALGRMRYAILNMRRIIEEKGIILSAN